MVKNLRKGFTLTELIIVIVIIGILAGVLIPTLSGYVAKSKKSAAEQEAAEIIKIYQNFQQEKDAESVEGGFAAYYKEVTGKEVPTSFAVFEEEQTVDGNGYYFSYRSDNKYTVYMNKDGQPVLTKKTN